VQLPRVAAAQAASATADRVVAAQVERGGTILLVEDDPPLRGLAERVLAGLGYTVLVAADGPAALELSARHTGQIDLIATDVVMPRMSGRALAERISVSRPAVKVLYMSGYTDDDVVRRGIGTAPSSFLQKPFTPDVLAQAVRDALAGSTSGVGATLGGGSGGAAA